MGECPGLFVLTLHEPPQRVPLLHLRPRRVRVLTDMDDATRWCVFDFKRNFYGRHTRFTTQLLGVGLHFREVGATGRGARRGMARFAVFCFNFVCG